MGSHALSMATFWNFKVRPFAFGEGLNLGRPASNNPTDLPDGQISTHAGQGDANVQPFREKYFVSRFGRHSITDSSRPASYQEGRIAIVTNVERGMRWTR
jgi:hypothetical protein